MTATARQMVMRFGMGETLGPRVFGHDHRQPFLDGAHKRAEHILLEHRVALTRIAEILLDRETIAREQFEALVAGEDEGDVFEPLAALGRPPRRARSGAGEGRLVA